MILLVIEDSINIELQKFEKLINDNVPFHNNFNKKVSDKIADFYLISCNDADRHNLMNFVSNFNKFKLVLSKNLLQDKYTTINMIEYQFLSIIYGHEKLENLFIGGCI